MSNKLEKKLDKILETQTKMLVAQERHNVILEDHSKRSDRLEIQNKLYADASEARDAKIEEELEPVKDHVEFMQSLPDKVIKLSKVMFAISVIASFMVGAVLKIKGVF